ncbi:hypothetical protein SEVIR_4G088266v4 [Setaria viridis]
MPARTAPARAVAQPAALLSVHATPQRSVAHASQVATRGAHRADKAPAAGRTVSPPSGTAPRRAGATCGARLHALRLPPHVTPPVAVGLPRSTVHVLRWYASTEHVRADAFPALTAEQSRAGLAHAGLIGTGSLARAAFIAFVSGPPPARSAGLGQSGYAGASSALLPARPLASQHWHGRMD